MMTMSNDPPILPAAGPRRTAAGMRIAIIAAALAAGAQAQAEAVFDGSMGPMGELTGDMIVPDSYGTQVGSNLFHSFLRLNVNPGESLTFTSDFAGPTDNVISRVTGADLTLVDGPVFNAVPGASLWLINPNGVVFGSGAFVDTQGGLHVSTADYIEFEDGGRFGADISVPENSTLSMASPAAFGFLTSTPAPVEIYGTGLWVPYGETLELVGGAVAVSDGFLGADGGTLGLAAVAAPGEVGLASDGYSGIGAGGDVTVSSTFVAANGDGGARVFIRGGQIVMQNETNIEAQTFGFEDGRGVSIVGDDVRVTGSSRILTETHGEGRGGDIDIEATGTVTIEAGSLVSTRVNWEGDAGDVTIRAGESILIDGANEFGFTTRVGGPTYGWGEGSDLLLEAPEITVSNGAFLWGSARSEGNAGTITLNGSDSVNLVGTDFNGFSGGIYANASQGGNASDVTVNTTDFNVLDAAYIIIGTYGPSEGGDLTVNASGDVNIAGVGVLNDPVQIWTGSRGTGPSGNWTVNATNMRVADGADVGTYAPGPSDAGRIELNIADTLTVIGQAQDDFGRPYQSMIDATGRDGSGGQIIIRADTVELLDGGILVATSFGAGDAGTVDVEADSFVTGGSTSGLVNEFGDPFSWTSGIWSVSEEGGRGGDITISAGDITIGRGSGIFSRADVGSGNLTFEASRSFTMGGEAELNDEGWAPWADIDAQNNFQVPDGVGGDITITAPEIDILGGSFIGTVSFYNGGQGGTIDIEAGTRLNIESGSGDQDYININSEAAFGAIPGDILLTAPDIYISDAYLLTDISFTNVNAGRILVTAEDSITLDNYTEMTSLSYYGGTGGDIVLTAPRVLFDNGASLISDTYGFADRAGNIYIDASDFTMRGGSSIEANSCFCAYGDGGSIFINADTFNIEGTGFINVQTGIFSTAFGSGQSGVIEINADVVNLTDVAVIGARSLTTKQDFIDIGEPDREPGDAGSIFITARELNMRESFIETFAAEAAGGSIELDISDMVYAERSFINAEAQGVDLDSNGGNIVISPPTFIILDRSGIVASANAGNGGNILLTTEALIAGPNSTIDASSRFGVDGRVVVESPNQLVAAVSPLEAPVLDVAEFNQNPCEVAVSQGRSSFTVPGSGGVTPAPADYQASPIIGATSLPTGGGGKEDQEAGPAECEVTSR
jgi:filamentous hemagglutinin family protein